VEFDDLMDLSENRKRLARAQRLWKWCSRMNVLAMAANTGAALLWPSRIPLWLGAGGLAITLLCFLRRRDLLLRIREIDDLLAGCRSQRQIDREVEDILRGS
jgi:hypothetical protein